MIIIELPPPLARLSGLQSVSLEAGSVREALSSLEKIYPGMADKIFNEAGEIRPHLLIFVNEDEIKSLQGVETKLSGGEKILILPAVSGG